MILKNFLTNNLPDFCLIFLYKIILCLRIIFWRVQIIHCPICKKSKKTFYAGLFPQISLICSGCFSSSRQRLIVNYLKKNNNLNKKKIIHFAPEQSLSKFINENYKIINYDKVDLIPKNRLFHMTELIEMAIMRKYKVAVYPIRDKDWIDTGQLSNYRMMNNI